MQLEEKESASLYTVSYDITHAASKCQITTTIWFFNYKSYELFTEAF